MQERTSIGLAAAALLMLVVGATGCASTPQVPEAPPAPGIALQPAQDFSRPERARAKMRAEGAETIPGEETEERAFGDPPGPWVFRAEAYAWLPSVDGEVGKGVTADVDLNLGDMWDMVTDHPDTSLAARFEGSNGDWGFLAEYVRIRTKGEKGNSSLRIGSSELGFKPELELDVLEVGARRYLGSAHTFSKYSPAVLYEAIGGARYVDADTKLKFAPGVKADADGNDWVDPFIGARASTQLSDGVTLALRGDVGGFGLGEASDFTWRADAVLRVKLLDSLGAFIGWQAYGVDQERGSGAGEYTYDLTFSGPYAGLQLDF